MNKPLSKNELELERIRAGGRSFTKLCDLVKGLLKYGCWGFCVWTFGDVIRDLAHGDPAAMGALCDVLKAIHAPQIFHSLLTIILGGGYAVEKQRNKRLVKNNGDNRHQREQADAVNSRSGLDRYGVAADE